MQNELYARNPKRVRYGTEAIPFCSPKHLTLMPHNIKDSSCLLCFKKSIRKSKPNCPCCLSKTFLQNVGFIWLNSSPPLSVCNLFAVHITCSCSYYVLSVRTMVIFMNLFIYESVLTFRIYRQLTLFVGFTLYCKSYLKGIKFRGF